MNVLIAYHHIIKVLFLVLILTWQVEICVSWLVTFFLILSIEHAVCWSPSISRPEHLPAGQSQLLRHQWEKETQSASALRLHSYDRCISLSHLSSVINRRTSYVWEIGRWFKCQHFPAWIWIWIWMSALEILLLPCQHNVTLHVK